MKKLVVYVTCDETIARCVKLYLNSYADIRIARTCEECEDALAEGTISLFVFPHRRLVGGETAEAIRKVRAKGYSGPIFVSSEDIISGTPYSSIQFEAGGPNTYIVEKLELPKHIRAFCDGEQLPA